MSRKSWDFNSQNETKTLILARMINLDEDALICDLAKTYQVYDYKSTPPTRVAVFFKVKETIRDQNET